VPELDGCGANAAAITVVIEGLPSIRQRHRRFPSSGTVMKGFALADVPYRREKGAVLGRGHVNPSLSRCTELELDDQTTDSQLDRCPLLTTNLHCIRMRRKSHAGCLAVGRGSGLAKPSF
jgi:hypothetical protein